MVVDRLMGLFRGGRLGHKTIIAGKKVEQTFAKSHSAGVENFRHFCVSFNAVTGSCNKQE